MFAPMDLPALRLHPACRFERLKGTSDMVSNDTPTPAAFRAARAIRQYSETETSQLTLRGLATIIDRVTSAPEMLGALRSVLADESVPAKIWERVRLVLAKHDSE